ncbi:MAG TPA: pyridoxal phosphate-dependent aminotransferase [Clostridia bacterium]|nr:pyridoxal phosphate-dependent aminotransferase [Clostridia bacterium]HPQ46124.1 pyridoxal phosphate-dependent aminotransferase [Clostridia bacterium]HRX41999.1 pyridoxal phosphate-dependent aminotransferase [Clostridia bacterium]
MISREIEKNLGNASFIRAMFEEGNKLKAAYGEENVFDFSIGNPEVEPPREVYESLLEIAGDKTPGTHRYMPNAGYSFVREAIAGRLSREYNKTVPADNICMVCGAAAGLNVVLKSILNPGEEVIIFAPYFAEYKFYIGNGGGVPVVVETDDGFDIDINLFKKAVTPMTKAVLINSPNNPTGVIYSSERLSELAAAIKEKEKEFNTDIFLLSDEPYNEIVYVDDELPVVFNIFEKAIVVNSYSKSLALPGERIGYIAVSPDISKSGLLMAAIIFNNRTLGFVNAPAISQRLVAKAVNASVDPEIYRERMDLLYNKLTELGFECKKPAGAFYLFVKSPVEDEMEFARIAQKYNILVVPGRGFGRAGYFRMAFCVSLETIKRSMPAFEKLAAEFF